MGSKSEFPLMPQTEKDKEKLELRRKYKNVGGERVLFLDEWIDADSVDVGDKLVWDEEDVKRVEILDPERRDEYYRVVEVDESVEGTGWVCYANLKLTGQYNFDEL
ncbi:hypothetical protein BDK61_2876 [Haloarcula quadrata]|uniref:Uncharacterized protein n=2 Tax=Haloarcula quadrata TaxID=182779 RepID=A0A495R864_9EURY|nr:hypothetical protein BDK61_2876 [Haloarcula quadrata]